MWVIEVKDPLKGAFGRLELARIKPLTTDDAFELTSSGWPPGSLRAANGAAIGCGSLTTLANASKRWRTSLRVSARA